MTDRETEFRVLALAAAMRRFLGKIDDERLAPFLADWPASLAIGRVIPPRPLPVLRWMAAFGPGRAGGHKDLAHRVAGSAHKLAWLQSYAEEDFGAEFLEHYGFLEVIGQRGPIASDRIAGGFLCLGPEIEYPAHRHEAEEIYVPLAGTTEWQQGGSEWARRKPGRLIHHPPWTPHAMRTREEPLLALYLWRGGDLTQKSLID